MRTKWRRVISIDPAMRAGVMERVGVAVKRLELHAALMEDVRLELDQLLDEHVVRDRVVCALSCAPLM